MSTKKPAGMRAGNRTKAETKTLDAAVMPPMDVPKVEPIGSAPATMSDDGRAVWRAAAPELERLKLLANADRLAFERYCEWLGRYRRLEKSMRRGGFVKTTKSKRVTMQRIDKRFQAMVIIDDKLMAYEKAFGMTPASRQAIFARLATGAPATPPPPPDPPKADQSPAPRGPIGILRGGIAGPVRLQ